MSIIKGLLQKENFFFKSILQALSEKLCSNNLCQECSIHIHKILDDEYEDY